MNKRSIKVIKKCVVVRQGIYYGLVLMLVKYESGYACYRASCYTNGELLYNVVTPYDIEVHKAFYQMIAWLAPKQTFENDFFFVHFYRTDDGDDIITWSRYDVFKPLMVTRGYGI